MPNLCVFCGANQGNAPEYPAAAVAMGQALARHHWGLVYGGGRIGLMGVIADATLAAGGNVIGVIPESLATVELLHPGVPDMRIVSSMHARKALMAELSVGFIAMPGGYGTFEELFEVITWAQLGIHSKPIGILNVSGYFDSLLQFLEHSIATGFIRPIHRELIVVSPDPSELLHRLLQHRMPLVPKWINPDES